MIKMNKREMKIQYCQCVGCESKNIRDVVDFGEFPIATTYSDYPDEKIIKHKLGLAICNDCCLIQNTAPIDPTDVYNDNYDYITGASSEHKKHLNRRLDEYKKNFCVNSNSNVLEIASNDGSFQDVMKENGINSVGIEPSKVPANIAIEKGHSVIIDFFNSESVKKHHLSNKFDIVIMNNVLTHTNNPVDMFISAKECISINGLIVLECMYLGDQLENHSFETVYHGNYTYLSLYSISIFADMAGTEVLGAKMIDSHGSSIRVWMGKNNSRNVSSIPKIELLEIEKREKKLGYHNMSTLIQRLNKFDLVISNFISNFKKFIDDENNFGRIVVGYGAAAKTATYISLLGRHSQKIKFICDINKNKWGKYFPGSNIEILEPSILNNSSYTIIVFPWNLFSEIRKQFELSNIRGRVVSIKEIIGEI